MMFLEGQLQHERKKMAADLAGRDSLINQIQRKFEAQEKMIELMQRQCEKETRLRSLMTYRQARPHVEKRCEDDSSSNTAQRMSRQDRARSSVRRRARSASITRQSPTTTTTSDATSTNAIVITRERRARLKIDQKDVSDDSGANLSPDITDSDTSVKQQSVKSDEKTTKQVSRKTRSNNLSSRKLLEIGITIWCWPTTHKRTYFAQNTICK